MSPQKPKETPPPPVMELRTPALVNLYHALVEHEALQAAYVEADRLHSEAKYDSPDRPRLRRASAVAKAARDAGLKNASDAMIETHVCDDHLRYLGAEGERRGTQYGRELQKKESDAQHGNSWQRGYDAGKAEGEAAERKRYASKGWAS